MIGNILAIKEEGYKSCLFCEMPLNVFIENLPDSFMEYEVQRGIVANVYLDKLVDTVLDKFHIPPITLVVEQANINGKELIIESYRILDGLQRTYRLKVIYDTINFFNEISGQEDLFSQSKYQLSRKYGEKLREINSSVIILEKIISYAKDNGIANLLSCYKENIQWFEVWMNLTDKDQVDKMLILNAGHKAVSLRHQLELLFLNLIPYFDKLIDRKETFKLVREKDVSSVNFSKNRKHGEFHFAHIISAMLSFINKETVTTNASLINKIQSQNPEEYTKYINIDFFSDLVSFLVKFDNVLEDKYKGLGTQWVAKESVIVGIFAALGTHYENKKYQIPKHVFEDLIDIVNNHDHILNLDSYEKMRTELNISKINLGNVTKKAVFQGILNLLQERDKIEWDMYF